MMNRVIAAVVLLCVTLSSPVAAGPQSGAGTGALEGVVADSAGGAAPGVVVLIRDEATGYARTLVTAAQGRFAAPGLPVGRYSIEATLQGFATLRQQGVAVSVGGTTTVALTLKPATVSEAVTVEASATAIDSVATAAASTVGLQQVADLPVRGRNFAEFVQLTPAVVQESDRFGLVVSGQRSINSNVAIDGADFNDPLQGNQRGGNESSFFFPQAAVREFQVVRAGLGAETGRTSAGFLNVVTKTGANITSGETFYLNRNRSLTSADAFGRRLRNQQNQFGLALGGPVVRNRSFFFLAVEQNFFRVPFVVKFQDQAAGVVVPAELAALEGEQHGTNNPTAVFLRNDWNLSGGTRLDLQYTYSRLRGQNFNFDSPQLDVATSANFERRTESHAVKGSLHTVISSRTLNELRFQHATDDRSENPNSDLPQVSITGFGTDWRRRWPSPFLRGPPHPAGRHRDRHGRSA